MTLEGKPSRARSRFAPHPVRYTRSWLRAAREAAWRDFEIASCVTQLVSKYHDEQAEGGRPHRVVVALHPSVTAKEEES